MRLLQTLFMLIIFPPLVICAVSMVFVLFNWLLVWYLNNYYKADTTDKR